MKVKTVIALVLLVTVAVDHSAISVPVRSASVEPVTFPVHLGPVVGESKSRSVPGVIGAAYLWIKTYNLAWEGKGSVRLNGGPWLVLNNSNCEIQGNAKNYGGIGGMFETMDYRIPLDRLGAPGASNTENAIEFRFNESDGNGSSYDVIDFDFLDSSASRLLPAGSLAYADPATYAAPPGLGSTAVAEGKALFTARNSLQSNNLPGHTLLKAACSDCHVNHPTAPGLDLEYFNYSNESIIDRAMFHGLDELQSKKIAAYIRSLTSYRSIHGRPWQPPYQPGAGLDSRPVSEWAAGAGLEAVLARDRDMIPYLFPQGITQAAVSYKADLNMRELPISIPFQSWNHWLPTVWPGEYWSDFESSPVSRVYEGDGSGSLLDTLSGPGAKAALESHRVKDLFNGWNSALSQYLRARGPDGRDKNGIGLHGDWTGKSGRAKALFSLTQWMQVKTFGMMRGFALEDHPEYFFSPPYAPRTWPTGSTFETSPYKRGVPYGGGTFDVVLPTRTIPENPVLYEGTNNFWYWAQIVLNGGTRTSKAGDHNPIDWGYTRGRIKDLSVSTQHVSGSRDGIWEFCRAAALNILGLQQGYGVGLPPNDPSYNGWSTMNYFRPDYSLMWGTSANGAQTAGHGREAFQDPGSPPLQERRQVLKVLLAEALVVNQQFTPKQYYGTTGLTTDPSARPVVGGQVNFPGATVNMLNQMESLGVDQPTINSYVRWAETIWPTNGYNWRGLAR